MDNSLEKDRLLTNLKALNKISQIVVESLDTNRMLMGVLKEVFAISGFNMGVIGETLDNKLKPLAAIGLSQRYIRELDGGLIKDMLCGHVLKSSKPLAIESDLPGQPISASVAPILIREGLESYVGIPIRLKQIPVAVLCLFDKHPKKLAEDKLELLISICNQLGGSIENSKLFQQTLEEKRDWENTFDSISDLVSIHDGEFNLVRCNKALAHKFNAKPEDIIGKKCYKVFHGTDEPLPNCPLVQSKQSLKPVTEEIEDPYMGGVFLISSFPRFDEWGKFSGCVEISRDITERKKTEFEIIRAREYTENLIETAQDAIVCIDEKGKITIWNKWAEKVFGYSKNEIMGQPIRTIITAKIFEAFLKTVKERIIGRTIEISGKTKEGIVIPIEMSLSSQRITSERWHRSYYVKSLIRDIDRSNERYMFTMIIRDATFQREAKRQLIEKKKELEKANSELVALITSQTDF